MKQARRKNKTRMSKRIQSDNTLTAKEKQKEQNAQYNKKHKVEQVERKIVYLNFKIKNIKNNYIFQTGE
jgi:hypothetical protein